MRLEEFDGKKGERKFNGKKGDEEEKFYSFDEDIIVTAQPQPKTKLGVTT